MSCISVEAIKELLDPLEHPAGMTGEDLRENISHDSSYQLLRDARTTARNNERAAAQNGDLNFINVDDWELIIERVPRVLAEESKDLELVAWLIEGLTRKYGFLGVARGYRLAAGLISEFGAELYPKPDEDGLSTQLGSLIGLNGFGNEGALIVPLKSIAIADSDVSGPVAVWQYDQALETDRLVDQKKKAARLADGVLAKAELEAISAATPDSFLKMTQSQLDAAIEAYKHFQEVVDEYAASEPQPTVQLADTLTSCRQMLNYVAGDRLQDPEVDVTGVVATEEQGTVGGGEDMPSPVVVAGVIHNRRDAVKTLQKVADYFRESEPHSPISYSIEQIIRWSDLSLPELIAQLIPDDSARQKFQTLSGIQAEQKG